ncbi:hypothetical protein L2E82_24769 [Cichorium intybus]|uniref:Uncharacterized protein n=1 Tax=Cichorium intybus TaxID=13427 RepID=A0ACB9E2E3_CICIN|nr:hypothetical protein L2E82_24769 [Cichorium intybus]
MLTQFETLKCTYALRRELSVMGYHIRFVYWKEMSMRVQEGRTFYYIFVIFTRKRSSHFCKWGFISSC